MCRAAGRGPACCMLAVSQAGSKQQLFDSGPRTCSGGMRQSARKPSGVSTGRGGSGGSSAARRTASTCVAGRGGQYRRRLQRGT